MDSQNPLRIVFLGTPAFATASLNALVEAGFFLVAVITAPDRPAGRGLHMAESSVKKYAVAKGIKVLQPVNLKNPEFISELKTLNADLQVVVAFRMLPEIVWNMPRLGTINVHGSLLPQYRGAAPINWVLINGEKQTGVTTFKLQQAIDTGDILLQETLPIGEDESAGELHDRMKIIGAQLLVKTLHQLNAGDLREFAQSQISIANGSLPSGELKHAPKIQTETCHIDWNQSVSAAYNLIRGLSPYPTAFTRLDGKLLKIFRSEKNDVKTRIEPGQYETDQKSFLRFACKDGSLSLTDLQLEGKKRMSIENFLKGYKFK